MESYFNGVRLNKEDEDLFLKENKCKNTGKLAEKYVGELLKNKGIKFKKNLRIQVDKSYIIPDFYLQDLDIILEIKSRGYNSPGTASEKIDNIPRKYSKIMTNNEFKNTKVFVVFCAYESINTQVLEIVNKTTEYSKDFTELCKKYNVVKWILVQDLLQELPIKVKPFVKWVGGKSKLKKLILNKFPEKYNNYHEPFVGGGCIGMGIGAEITKSFSDTNRKLINCYDIVKNDVDGLILELSKPEYVNEKDQFYKLRTRFNDPSVSGVELAALFIYLNKCCFNGMYRENKSGDFNVPFGDMKSPLICDIETLKNASQYLQNVDITCKSVFDITPEPGDIVYFDPPYHLTFSDYCSSGFGQDSHLKLRDFVKKISDDGIFVILSNSSTDFIKEIYSEFNIEVINTRYSISCSERKTSDEVLITNFQNS